MIAALALGAEGVQCATRFLTVDECSVCDAWKQKVIDAKDSDTIVTGRGSGHPFRGLKNRFSRECRKLEAQAAAGADVELSFSGSLKRAVDGDVEGGAVMAGQISAIVGERKRAADVVTEMIAEAERLGAKTAQEMTRANAAREGLGS